MSRSQPESLSDGIHYRSETHKGSGELVLVWTGEKAESVHSSTALCNSLLSQLQGMPLEFHLLTHSMLIQLLRLDRID